MMRTTHVPVFVTIGGLLIHSYLCDFWINFICIRFEFDSDVEYATNLTQHLRIPTLWKVFLRIWAYVQLTRLEFKNKVRGSKHNLSSRLQSHPRTDTFVIHTVCICVYRARQDASASSHHTSTGSPLPGSWYCSTLLELKAREPGDTPDSIIFSKASTGATKK